MSRAARAAVGRTVVFAVSAPLSGFLIVLSAGRGTEARVNEYKRRGGATTELWNLPEAAHAAACAPTGPAMSAA